MLTKNMRQSVAAAALVPVLPPVSYMHGDPSVVGTFAQRSAVTGGLLIADDVEGVLPRGVPV